MTTTRVETLPATWESTRDLPFFRITERLFSPDFCFGATVLLASYDDDALVDTAAAAERRTSTATTACPDTHVPSGRGLTPVQVRRTR